jgi:hypothetical protein
MDKDILRRIAERGLARAQREEDSEYCDIFQHFLDELERADQRVPDGTIVTAYNGKKAVFK